MERRNGDGDGRTVDLSIEPPVPGGRPVLVAAGDVVLQVVALPEQRRRERRQQDAGRDGGGRRTGVDRRGRAAVEFVAPAAEPPAPPSPPVVPRAPGLERRRSADREGDDWDVRRRRAVSPDRAWNDYDPDDGFTQLQAELRSAAAARQEDPARGRAKNLVMSLSAAVADLTCRFAWLDADQRVPREDQLELRDELADAAADLLRLADALNVDLAREVRRRHG